MAKTPLIHTYIGNRTTIAISVSFDTLSLIHKLSNNAHFASIPSSLLGGAATNYDHHAYFAEIVKMELDSPIQPEKRSPAFSSLRPPKIPSLVPLQRH